MLFFIHIPKTAGTTFYEVVKNNHKELLKPKVNNTPNLFLNKKIVQNSAIRLPGGYQTAPEILKIIGNLNLNYISKIDFIGGHVGYGFHQIINQKIDYISFVRKPEDRIISDFKEHCKEGRFFYDKLKNNNFCINYYLNLLLESKLDNLFTRQTAGPYNFFLKDRKIVDRNLFEKAKKNSLNITFFTINNFNEALFYMKKKYNWKNTKYSIKNKSSLTAKEINYNFDLMKKVISYDKLLFDYISVVNSKKFNNIQKLKFNLMNKIQ